jgi:predicted Zn finger-like uncharacterized protein
MAPPPRLAARCPACLTVFRLAADQLKLRGGLVRCGQCNTVFHGDEHLLNLGVEEAVPSDSTHHPAAQTGFNEATVSADDANPLRAEPHSSPLPAAATLLIARETSADEVEGTPAPVASPHSPDSSETPETTPETVGASSSDHLPQNFAEHATPELPEAAALSTPDDHSSQSSLATPTVAPGQSDIAPNGAAKSAQPGEQLDDSIPNRDPGLNPSQSPIDDSAAADGARSAQGDVGPSVETSSSVGRSSDHAPKMIDEDGHATQTSPRGQDHVTNDVTPDAFGVAPENRSRPLRYRPAPLGAHRWVFRAVECRIQSDVNSDTPAFVRSAREEARAARASSRWLWRGVLAMLALSALAQAAYWWRSPLAAAYPSLRPVLQQACSLVGCTIPPTRQIARLVIDGTELQQPDATYDHYLLSLNLRSRATAYVSLPALELQLTDLDDKVVVRRVLQPAEYLPPSERTLEHTGLPPDTELALRVRFYSQAAAVNYRVRMFYP